MRLTIAPDGTATVETEDASQAAALIHELQKGKNGTFTEKKQGKKPVERKRLALPAAQTPAEHLSKELGETWNWLVANGASSAGATTDQVAAGLGITTSSAGYRIKQLLEKGLAHRVKRGRYRPGEAIPGPNATARQEEEQPSE